MQILRNRICLQNFWIFTFKAMIVRTTTTSCVVDWLLTKTMNCSTPAKNSLTLFVCGSILLNIHSRDEFHIVFFFCFGSKKDNERWGCGSYIGKAFLTILRLPTNIHKRATNLPLICHNFTTTILCRKSLVHQLTSIFSMFVPILYTHTLRLGEMSHKFATYLLHFYDNYNVS